MGSSDAAYMCAILLEENGNIKESIKYLGMAADKNYYLAVHRLIPYFIEGVPGVFEKNIQKAVEFYKRYRELEKNKNNRVIFQIPDLRDHLPRVQAIKPINFSHTKLPRTNKNNIENTTEEEETTRLHARLFAALYRDITNGGRVSEATLDLFPENHGDFSIMHNFLMASLLENGSIVTEDNFGKSIEFYTRAALAKNVEPTSTAILSYFFRNGIGVNKDKKTADYLIKRTISSIKYIKKREETADNIDVEISPNEILSVFIYALGIRDRQPDLALRYFRDLNNSCFVPSSFKNNIDSIIAGGDNVNNTINNVIKDINKYLMYVYIKPSYAYTTFLSVTDCLQVKQKLSLSQIIPEQNIARGSEGLQQNEPSEANAKAVLNGETNTDVIANGEANAEAAPLDIEELSEALRRANNNLERATTSTEVTASSNRNFDFKNF